MRVQFLISFLLLLCSDLLGQPAQTVKSKLVYDSIDGDDMEKPPFDIFRIGFAGYAELVYKGQIPNPTVLTLIDYRKSGNDKRLWIIDLAGKKILYHSLVSHGRNSGDLYATKFSNTLNSNQRTNSIRAGDGLIGSLLTDTTLNYRLNASMEEIYNASANTSTAAKDLNQILTNVKQGEGTLGVLLTDTLMIPKLNQSLDNIEEGTHRFNENMEAMKHNFLFRKYFKKIEKDSIKNAEKKHTQ